MTSCWLRLPTTRVVVVVVVNDVGVDGDGDVEYSSCCRHYCCWMEAVNLF